jgi:ABC-type multidrug transport system ATPase subunit
VAIASVGDPDIIFLDEPTTGLDPRNKIKLWRVIERQKKNRLIVLTTHSMEEADALGDKIVILALGRYEVG